MIQKILFTPLAHYLRQWDRTSAAGVDHFIANSAFIARRITSCYRRESTVIHPPVDLDHFNISVTAECKKDYYFILSELVPYKRIDLAVEAFRINGKQLKIAGQGPDFESLQHNAPDNITFLGRVDSGELPRLYAEAQAFIFPGKEDFGITPLEANACGTPVIAYRAGGILDTQTDETALFFDKQTAQDLNTAIEQFESRRHIEGAFSATLLQKNAHRFSVDIFKQNMQKIIAQHSS